MKRVSFVLMIALALTAAPAAIAQPAQGSMPATTVQGQQPGPGRTTATSQGLGRFQAVNVRVELTITDQSGAGAPVKKTVTMLLADGFDGRVRSSGMITDAGNIPRYNVQLNADASVSVLGDDKVRAQITVEYSAARSVTIEQQQHQQPLPPSALNETVTTILVSGKPTLITQSADPATDRKVSVEATATIIR